LRLLFPLPASNSRNSRAIAAGRNALPDGLHG
jgi:hypothetical protein